MAKGIPLKDDGAWRRIDGGTGWQVLPDGRIKVENGIDAASDSLERYLALDDDGCVRTDGPPLTARTLLEEHGDSIFKLGSEMHGIAPQTIAGVIVCESLKMKGSYSRNYISLREEPGFVSWEETPHRGSAGLMQTLLSTARETAKREGIVLLDALGRERELVVGDMIVPSMSITLGAAYLKAKARRYDTHDPFVLTCAYNCGSAKVTSKNEFRIKSHGGADRILKHAAYANDFLAAMREAGL